MLRLYILKVLHRYLNLHAFDLLSVYFQISTDLLSEVEGFASILRFELSFLRLYCANYLLVFEGLGGQVNSSIFIHLHEVVPATQFFLNSLLPLFLGLFKLLLKLALLDVWLLYWLDSISNRSISHFFFDKEVAEVQFEKLLLLHVFLVQHFDKKFSLGRVQAQFVGLGWYVMTAI